MNRYAAIPLCVILLSGCSFIPEHIRPSVDSSETWRESSAVSAEAAAVNAEWWKNFQSAELNALMDEALAQNLDVRASLQRIAQSRAAVRVSGADLLPQAGASAGTQSGTGGDSWSAGANVSYAIDLFGGNRANLAAARAGLRATEYDAEAIRLLVMGDVATGYFNLLNIRERLVVADRNLELAHEVLRVAQVQFETGRSSALEVSQQKTALASAEASRASVALQLSNVQNSLAVLLGKAPANLSVQEQQLTGLLIPSIAPEQPSTLLERRPDIRAAEATLEQAEANIGAARSAFFPTLSLGAGVSIGAAGFGAASDSAYSLASSLVAPIFQGGRLRGNLEGVTARQLELVEVYRKTVLTAFQEVENALAGVKAAETREAALLVAQTEAQKSYDLSLALYDAGSIDFITLLDAQRTLLSAQDSYVQSRFERLSAATQLYLALGGGWNSDALSEAAAGAPVAVIDDAAKNQPDTETLPRLDGQTGDEPQREADSD
ncbi:MAG: efflux transporter outer membrane subunit [Alphaproteobacteria bacterium]|nr:efflux transporter outer membrane subunit [Alphaproteobacteria bacterium]